MPENCNYDLFHEVKFLPKWGKSTDYDQNVNSWKGSQDTWTCQIARSHAFRRKLPETSNLTCFTNYISQNDAKNGKLTDHDQNLTSSEGGQDTSVCQSSGHSSLAFSSKCPEVANLACFTQSKWCQNEENQQMMTQIYQLWSGQDTSACQISGHSKWLQ